MMGSYADAEDAVQDVLLKAWRARESYVPNVPMVHWLMRIGTTTCLTALAARSARGLPQLDGRPLAPGDALERLEPSRFVTPAPDVQLFRTPAEAAEARENVALAFVALLQRLPAKQRAVLLLKDVVGWSSEEIAEVLELTPGAVSSALHRARETLGGRPRGGGEDPSPQVLRDYVRSWEAQDVDSLVGLLKSEVVLAMPPFSCWVYGVEAVRGFLEKLRLGSFWSNGVLGTPTRANGSQAIAWYVRGPDGRYAPHSLEVVRFDGDRVAETTHFIGGQHHAGFDVPPERA
jgi:RNA polymerase sigma-70 factor (ECF subfamily)